jgi:CheY-like chemotaxis protein
MTSILVVDDNKADLYLLQMLLQGHGYEVTTATNGLEALTVARRDPPDLIVADVLMPGMDGFALCRHWRQDPRLRDIPFVFYTATYTDPRDQEFALNLGADRFMVKPEELEVLVQSLLEVMAARQTGRLEVRRESVVEEPVYLKQYNETLIRKLETKLLELQEANHTLEQEMTERQQAEEARERLQTQLRQAQTMEAIGTLAAGIAHDFNNILGAILGYTELAQEDLPPDHPVQQKLQEVFLAGHRARDLVQQILTFSRQSVPERRPVRLHQIVQDTLRFLRASLPTTIDVHQSLETTMSTVLADSTQMHQVLLNLCSNAEHAMRATGGVLEVRLAAVEVTADFAALHPPLQAGPHVRLTVQDTGHGMAPEILARIFEPFFTTKGVGEGTGLGLAVVHGILTEHGGAIAVQSTLGHGTTVDVYLPCSAPATAASHTAAVLHPGQGRILFVDDEATLARVGQSMLERLGYHVVAYTSSVEALAAFRSAPQDFDLVITDQTMPEMPGEIFAHELRGIRPDIPIILCTGFSYAMTAERAAALGMQAYLLKPLLIHTLSATIHRVLGHTHDEKG